MWFNFALIKLRLNVPKHNIEMINRVHLNLKLRISQLFRLRREELRWSFWCFVSVLLEFPDIHVVYINSMSNSSPLHLHHFCCTLNIICIINHCCYSLSVAAAPTVPTAVTDLHPEPGTTSLTQTHKHTTLILSLYLSLSLSLSLSHTHTHSLTHSHSNSLSLSLFLSHTHSQTRAHTFSKLRGRWSQERPDSPKAYGERWNEIRRK